MTIEICDRTRRARENANIDAKDMARILGIEYQAYMKYEKRSVIKAIYIPTFCKATEINEHWLLTGEGARDRKPSDWFEQQAQFISGLAEEERNRFEEGLRFIFPDKFGK